MTDLDALKSVLDQMGVYYELVEKEHRHGYSDDVFLTMHDSYGSHIEFLFCDSMYCYSSVTK